MTDNAATPSRGVRWLPRRTGAVLLLALFGVFDVLAILAVLAVIAALASSGAHTPVDALSGRR